MAPPKPLPEQVEGPSIGPRSQGPLPIVMSARIGEHEDRTRLVIELSDPVNLRAFTLANPDRVVIDMPEVSWRLGAPPRPSGFGPVKSYRYGLFRAGNSRMVIDLNSAGDGGRSAGAAAVSRFRLPRRDRPVPHHAAQIRRPGRLAGRSEEARKRCGEAGRADRRRSSRRPPETSAKRSSCWTRAMAGSIPERSASMG